MRKILQSMRALIAACLLLGGTSFAWGQVSTWTYSTTNANNTYGAEFDGSTAGVVKVQLGATSEAASWSVFNYSSRNRGVSHTNHTATLSEEVGQTAVPVSGTFMIVKPTVDIIFEINGYSSENIYVYLVSSETPTTNTKINGQYRVKNSWTCNAGTLKAGVTYYIYGDSQNTAFTGFTATSYELYFLNLQIDKAQALYDDEVTYTEGRTVMNTALTTAKTLAANGSATNEQLNAGWKALENSKNVFKAANGNDTYGIESDELVWQGKEINAVAGMKMTYGGAADVNWTYESGRGPGFHAGANATLTSGIPTAGTFVKFEPTSNGVLTLNWYAYATGGTVTATLIDADQTIKEVKTHSKNNSESNGSFTDNYTTLLRPGVTYYLYLQGTNYNNTFKGFVFSKKTDVEVAVYDCKAYETSAAFTNAIDAETFSSAAEVYAFHSAWQIAQAQTNGSTDYSKAIMNRTFELRNTNGWTITGDAATGENISDSNANGVVEYGENWSQFYTGWNGRNVSQTIAGLPAGTYRLTAKVYSWSGGAPVRLFANGQLSDAENGDDHDPVLDFTVTGNETSIKMGIGGIGNNNDTDNTWGTWGYRVKNFTLTKTGVSATIGAKGYTTFASQYALDCANLPDGLTAYYVESSNIDKTKNKVTLTPITEAVAAGTGMLLQGTASTSYDIPVVASGTDLSATNKMVGCTTETVLTSTTTNVGNFYVLVNGTTAAEFQNLATYVASHNVTIPAGKAYLDATGVSSARLTISFGDEATGIKTVQGEGVTVNGYYDLQGRRVAQPAKGLYIVNGKKMVIK